MMENEIDSIIKDNVIMCMETENPNGKDDSCTRELNIWIKKPYNTAAQDGVNIIAHNTYALSIMKYKQGLVMVKYAYNCDGGRIKVLNDGTRTSVQDYLDALPDILRSQGVSEKDIEIYKELSDYEPARRILDNGEYGLITLADYNAQYANLTYAQGLNEIREADATMDGKGGRTN